MCFSGSKGWGADRALKDAAGRTGARGLALHPSCLGGLGGRHAVGMLDDLGHEPVLCHQLECHLIASLYLVRLSEQSPSLHTAICVSFENLAQMRAELR